MRHLHIKTITAWLCRIGARRPATVPQVVVKNTKLPIMRNSATLFARIDLESMKIERCLIVPSQLLSKPLRCSARNRSCKHGLRVQPRGVAAELRVLMGKAADVLTAVLAITSASFVFGRVVRNFILGMCEPAIFSTWATFRIRYEFAGCVPIPDSPIWSDWRAAALTLKVEMEAPHRLVTST